jgi:hypothetical protein
VFNIFLFPHERGTIEEGSRRILLPFCLEKHYHTEILGMFEESLNGCLKTWAIFLTVDLVDLTDGCHVRFASKFLTWKTV